MLKRGRDKKILNMDFGVGFVNEPMYKGQKENTEQSFKKIRSVDCASLANLLEQEAYNI